MDYRRCVIEEKIRIKKDLYRIKVSKWKGYEDNPDTAGKFYFIMLGEMGEKPFALFSYSDRQFIIKRVGPFTTELTKLKVGDVVFIRGPYGNEITNYSGKTINLVGGGTGISPTFEIARKYMNNNTIRFFFGGKEKNDIFSLDKFKEIGEVVVSTEDGSMGTKGFVSDAMKEYNFQDDENNIFINVGPRPMIEAVYSVEKNIVSEENIWVSIEYQTCCGVGICGKCATETGALSCIDGPFLKVEEAIRIKECEHG